MDIVVRTPHGDADVHIGAHGAQSTLGDLIAEVTGQAVPRLARVDDLMVDCTTPLDEVGLTIGSLVVTDPPAPEPSRADDVRLVQIAGRGAGRVATLSPGDYRIGPGRRASADELASAPVERTAFELTVATDGVVTVDATHAADEVRLGGSPLRATTPWREEIVTVAGRAFVIDRRPPLATRRPAPADPDGTVPFSRPPRRSGEPARLPVFDARRDAMSALPSLWQRRPGQPDAYAIPIGLRPDDAGDPLTLELDLFGERAVAVTGADDERTAIARTILVEATTLHGPADLDVAIVTSPDRVAEWEWAKWLPHLRLGGAPVILSEPDAIAEWVTGAAGHRLISSSPWPSAHLTLLVLDDANVWQRRNSPLRTVLASPPAELRVIALCGDPSSAPALCSTMITRTGNDSWRVAALTSRHDIDGVMIALTEPEVAGEIARALAPLADVDLPATLARPGADDPAHSLSDLLGDLSGDSIRRRWDEDDLSAVVVGHRRDDVVTVDLGAGNLLVTGSDPGNVTRTASTVVLAACSSADPASTWVLDLASPRHGSRWGLAALPHATDPDLNAADIDAIEPDRLVARLRHVAQQPGHPRRILVTVDRTTDPALADALLAATLGPEAIGGLLVVVLSDRHTRPATTFARTIGVRASPTARLATVAVGDGAASRAFHLDRTVATSELTIRPAVLGRPLTALEHRLEQRSRDDRSAMADAERIAQTLSLAAGDLELPTMLPRRLPDRVDTDELFTAHVGDGVPIGLVDAPATEPLALWWQPEPGIVLAFGAVRSGVDDVISTIVLGVVDRFGDDDVRVVLVDHSAGRRRVVASLSQCSLVVDPERDDDVTALVALLAEPRAVADPTLVVLIDDVGRLRTHAAAAGRGAELDAALGDAAVRARCAIVAVARSIDAPGPLLTPGSQRYVGTMADPAEAHRLGVSLPVDGPRGRCRQVPGGQLVQLAVPDRPITTSLPQRLAEPQQRSSSREEPS